jgi:hypothetical protein
VLVLCVRDGEELEQRVTSRAFWVRDVQRAELVMLAPGEVSDREVGRRVGMHYNQVAVWRRR